MFRERLDEREDVVPAAAVEPGHVVAKLVDDLVHLEGGRQRLDQHRRLDRAVRDAERLLGVGEDLVPQPRLEMALELRQVEVGPAAGGERGLRIEEEVEAEIEQRARHRLAVDDEMLLGQMPAARPDEQHRRLGAELVVLAGLRVGEVDRPLPAVLEVDLALDDVRPGRRIGVLEVGHEHLRAGVERVDDHLAVDRAGDLDPAVEQVGGIGATTQSPSRISFVSGRKSGSAPASSSCCRASRRRSSRSRVGLNFRCSPTRNVTRLVVQHFLVARPPGPAELDARNRDVRVGCSH